MKMSRCLALAVAFVAFAGVSLAQAPDLSHADLVLQSVPDGPVAKVNGENIEREEFISLYETEIIAWVARTRNPKVDDKIRLATGVRTVQLLIQHELLYQEARKRKLTVTDDELNAGWTAAVDQLRKRVALAEGKDPSEADKAEAGVSEADLLKRAGLNKDAAQNELRKRILVNKMREAIVKEKGIAVTDAEIASFFEKHKEKFKTPDRIHLQRIFVATRNGQVPYDEKKKAEARKRIETALKRVQAGESFETVAKDVSEAPDKANGGDLGPVPTAQLPPVVVEAASKLKPGDVSDVIEGEQGLNIIKLIDTMPGSDGSLDKAKDFIKNYLMAQKSGEALDAFCKPLAEKPGAIEVYLQLEKTLASNPKYRDLLEEMRKDAGGDTAPESAAKPAASSPKKESASKAAPAKPDKKKKKAGK